MPLEITKPDEFVTRMRRRPFVPYTIVTKDGHRYSIVRPFQAATNETIVVVAPPTGDGSFTFKFSQIAAIVEE